MRVKRLSGTNGLRKQLKAVFIQKSWMQKKDLHLAYKKMTMPGIIPATAVPVTQVRMSLMTTRGHLRSRF